MKLEEPLVMESLSYCTRVLDKNIGIVITDPEEVEQLLYRAKAYFRKAMALIYIGDEKSLQTAE